MPITTLNRHAQIASPVFNMGGITVTISGANLHASGSYVYQGKQHVVADFIIPLASLVPGWQLFIALDGTLTTDATQGTYLAHLAWIDASGQGHVITH